MTGQELYCRREARTHGEYAKNACLRGAEESAYIQAQLAAHYANRAEEHAVKRKLRLQNAKSLESKTRTARP